MSAFWNETAPKPGGLASVTRLALSFAKRDQRSPSSISGLRSLTPMWLLEFEGLSINGNANVHSRASSRSHDKIFRCAYVARADNIDLQIAGPVVVGENTSGEISANFIFVG